MQTTIEIKELSITIKTLSVDDKKMTLAVFRQIPFKSYVQNDSSYQLLGWVDYHIEMMQGSSRYWLVFIHNGVLYKSNLNYISAHQLNSMKENLASQTEDVSEAEKALAVAQQAFDDIKSKNLQEGPYFCHSLNEAQRGLLKRKDKLEDETSRLEFIESTFSDLQKGYTYMQSIFENYPQLYIGV